METSYLFAVAATTILVAFFWAASVAFTFWDAHRRDLSGVKVLVWVALAILLPFAGLGLYLVARALGSFLSPDRGQRSEGRLRSTALKRQPALAGQQARQNQQGMVRQRPPERPMPTFMAAELVKDTIAIPEANPDAAPDPGAGSPILHFLVLDGPCLGMQFAVGALPAVIGRGVTATIRLDQDLGVSRKHAEVYERDGRLWIRDLNSIHGTLVNDIRIQDASLESGDRLQVGLSALLFERSSSGLPKGT